MTKRFTKAVKQALADDIITEEEMKLLLLVAEEESISRIDAELYIRAAIKKGGQKFPKVYRNAVKDAIRDGIVTEEEENSLKQLAKREGIDEEEAHLYLKAALKKRVGGNKVRNVLGDLGNAFVSNVLIPGLSALAMAKIENKYSDNKKR